MKHKITNFVRKNKKELIIIGSILLIGAFFRLFKIDQYMTFLGDEGRDVIIVRRIFTEFHPPLIGPGTSVGGMYLGPLYYYMMAIPLLIAGFSPVGPAVMVALLGVATIAFVWWSGRKWFGKSAGLIAAGLYAISPTVIIFSHSSWNPDIMPFFALLSIYSAWKIWKERNLGWLITLGISFAFVLQSHYLGLLLIPTLFIFWFLAFREFNKIKQSKIFINKSVVGLVCFLVLMSPLFIFDLRHNFMNAKAVNKFFNERQTVVSAAPWLAIGKIPQMFNFVNNSLIAAKNSTTTVISSVVILAGIIFLFIKNFIKRKNLNIKGEFWLLISWLGFGLIGLSFYKQSIYDHYVGFLFPVPFLLIGIFISKLMSGKIYTKILGGALLIYLIAINLAGNPFRNEPNKLLRRSMDVSRSIADAAGGKQFNFAVIAERNYEDGYKYFLDLWGEKVLHADRWDPSTISDTLFVVCENEPSKCDPTHSPKAEVANFGMSRIEQQWEIGGVIIYKLVHTK